MKIVGKISLILILLIFSFNRCELLDNELNYVLVTVDMWVYVYDKENNRNAENISVNMLIQKDQGEKIEGIGTTGSDGKTQATGKFKLYREQPIELRAWIAGKPESVVTDKLVWETVDQNASEPDKDRLRTYFYPKSFYLSF